MIKTGQININNEIFSLLSLSAMVRQGHLEAVLHIMGYLKLRHRIVFDQSYLNIDHSNYWKCDCPMHHHQEGKRWIYESS